LILINLNLDKTKEGLEEWTHKYSHQDNFKSEIQILSYKFNEKYEGNTLEGMRHGYGKYFYKKGSLNINT
jgi:hypothetical protein